MLNPRHFMKMSRWVRNPPGEKRVKYIFGVILLCFLIAGFELLFGWPDALRVNSLR